MEEDFSNFRASLVYYKKDYPNSSYQTFEKDGFDEIYNQRRKRNNLGIYKRLARGFKVMKREVKKGFNYTDPKYLKMRVYKIKLLIRPVISDGEFLPNEFENILNSAYRHIDRIYLLDKIKADNEILK